MQVTAEQIAQMYKACWQVEVFFRWIKQHLNVPTLFGTSENAVYGQLYTALMVYVLLKSLYDATSSILSRHVALSFARLLDLGQLPVEWRLRLFHILQTDGQNKLIFIT
ncbi:transposase [Paenibacillus profundus]|uniref:transposase n=1 Tax=Paenibacillus profundus TaxID=1173085 RepID=UPI0038993147